jgi:asparagine synthase (glutamine-hydrolysing)
MVHRLRGMFAIAIADLQRDEIFLARDPYGIKPLYFADDGHTLRFASQVKALLAGGQISREPDAAGWVGFHLFGNVPEPMTTYRRIHAVPAGATMRVSRNGAGEPVKYFSVSDAYRNAENREMNPANDKVHERFAGAFADSVKHHMVADVPVGIFLSAGVDSGALLGLMRDSGARNLQAVTLAYEEFKGSHANEAPLAARSARAYECEHDVRVVTEKEFRDDLPRIFEAMDQPTVDGINTWFVSKAARERGLKAAISGVGGDELLGGYPSFTTVPRLVRWLGGLSRRSQLGETFRHLAAGSGLATMVNPKLAGLVTYGGSYAGAYFLQRGLFMPWELETVMDRDLAAEGLRAFEPRAYVAGTIAPEPRTAFGKIASLESSIYMRNQLLRDTDWASMAHSIEVRVPFVDAHLLRAIAPVTVALPAGQGKRYLAASPKRPLPAEVVNRKKTGFATPVQDWLQRDQRLQAWRRVPQLAQHRCPWARRWAYQSAAA